MSVKLVPVHSDGFTIWYDVLPETDRYTSYPDTGSEEPLGASQLSSTSYDAACPVPVRTTVAVPPEPLLVTVAVPLADPDVVGSNSTSRVAVFPGFSVSGVVTPETLKPAPLAPTALTVTAAVPDDVSVTVCVDGVFRSTLPNATLVVLSVSDGVAAFSWMANVFDTPLALAVSVAVCAVVTADAVAVNDALVAPEATVTDAGTVTDELLLSSPTANPPLGAVDVSVTVHASVVAPVSELLLHVMPLSAAVAVPVPLRLIDAVAGEALSLTVTVPVALPAVVGSNSTVSVAVDPGFSVTGVLTPDSLKPVPDTVTPLTVSADVPDDVSVTVSVAGSLTVTFPNATLVVLTDNAGLAAFSSMANVFDTPLAVAVSVTDCAVVTADAVAVNDALVAPEATVTDAGTATAELLLASDTVIPLLGAAAVSVTVHASVAAPVSELLLHDTALSAAVGADAVPAAKAAICITHAPDSFSVAFALLLAAVVAVLSSTRSESGSVTTRSVYPLPTPPNPVATVFAPTTSSFVPVVVAAPLLALALLPLLAAVTSRLAAPSYSSTRTSGYTAAWLKVTVTVLLPPAIPDA